MAKPVCTSLDSPPARVEGTTVTVGDQNWQQGLENGAKLNEPRFVKSWSLDGGASWSVPGPPRESDPAVPVPGQTFPGHTSFDFRGYLRPGETKNVLFEIAAGTHSVYHRSDGSVAYDVIEWGNKFVSNDDSGAPVRFTVPVTAAGTPEPTPGETLEKLKLTNTGINAAVANLEKVFDAAGIAEPDGLDALKAHLFAVGAKINELVDAFNADS